MVNAAPNSATRALASGDKLPTVGLGLWKIPKDQCADTVFNAIQTGYRLLDSACDYGNEEQTGAGIKRALEAGLCSRADLFVVSKLWNTYHRPEHVKLACQKSLADLGVEYLDLYLVHFPIATKFVPFETRYPPEWFFDPSSPEPRMELDTGVTYQQTWQAMEQLVRDGLVKNIGVCNVGTTMLRQMMSYAEIKPAVLQVEMHPYLTQKNLLRYALQSGMQVMSFSNLASASYVELQMATAEESVIAQPCVQEIATRHGKTPAQVVLRWGVQRGTTIIPKTTKLERLQENFSVLDFELSEADMDTISALNKNRRFNDPGHFCEVAFNTFCPIYD